MENDPDFWSEIGWTAVWIVAAFIAAGIAIAAGLISYGVGWQ